MTSEFFTVEPEREPHRNGLSDQSPHALDASHAEIVDRALATWTVDTETERRKRHPLEIEFRIMPQANEEQVDDLSSPLAG